LTPQRILLLIIAALAGLSYAWGLSRDPLEPFYAAAVRSMSTSWHNFFFGSFDPAGTVTLDKLPGAFWIQAVSVRLFGYHTWAIVLPQVLEGILSVLFLYRAVNRLRGTGAALVAAVILAASPATVALNRGNIADTAMTLFLVLAADAVSAAIVSGRQRHLVATAVWVAIAFQAKMVEAWLVLPGFALAYLFGRPEGLPFKLRRIAVAGLVAGVVSLAWMTVVTVTPTGDRPYVDGSQHNSVYEQVFVYNGLGRTGQLASFEQLTAGLNPELVNGPPPAWNRLARGDLGRDTGWLLPAALAVGVGGLFTRRRSYYILWIGWLVPMVVVFSYIFTIHTYYTAALSPPIAAILGSGVASGWESRREARALSARRSVTAAVIVAGTVGYGIWLTRSSGASGPIWLWPLATTICVVAAGLLLAWHASRASLRLYEAALIAGTVAILTIPTTASTQLALEHRGIADTPFESAQSAAAFAALLGAPSARVGSFIPQLEQLQKGAPYLMAVYTSAVASAFISASGKEVLPIGGFTGSIPEPTISKLETLIRSGKLHLVLMTGGDDPRLTWIASHCQDLQGGAPVPGLFSCTPSDASPTRG
jgi:4-amino-4-deoxy-L-arabinose transferase-like glycosyltransferase